MGWDSGHEEEEEEEEEVVVVVVTYHSLQNVTTREQVVRDFSSPRADVDACLGCWEYNRAVEG